MIDFSLLFFFFNDTATTEIYTLSLHDALPISDLHLAPPNYDRVLVWIVGSAVCQPPGLIALGLGRERHAARRSEEHTSELQSRQYLVCRLLLEKKKKTNITTSL